MLAILEFIFSSFWIWLGCVILLAIIVQTIYSIINAVTYNIYKMRKLSKVEE